MKTLALHLLLLFGAVSASAAHYADFYVIPAASHTAGANGTMWMSDVAIQNFQSTALEVQLVLIESGQGNADNVHPVTTTALDGSTTVPANGSVLLSDVLNGYRGRTSTIGAILIGADRPFAVTSRSYSMSPAGDTVGQTVLPVAGFIDNSIGTTDPATAVAYIPGLIQTARFRTNLGMVIGGSSASTDGAVVSVTLRNAAGSTIGTRSYAVPAGQYQHLQFSMRDITGQTVDIGSAEFRITGGSGAVVPYASVIDNVTADAVYVSGQFPPNASPAMGGMEWLKAPSLFRDLFDQVAGQ